MDQFWWLECIFRINHQSSGIQGPKKIRVSIRGFVPIGHPGVHRTVRPWHHNWGQDLSGCPKGDNMNSFGMDLRSHSPTKVSPPCAGLPGFPSAPRMRGLIIVVSRRKPFAWQLGWSKWRFPEIGVPPVIIQFNRVFPNKNHPAIGIPPWRWKPQNMENTKDIWGPVGWAKGPGVHFPAFRSSATNMLSYCERLNLPTVGWVGPRNSW